MEFNDIDLEDKKKEKKKKDTDADCFRVIGCLAIYILYLGLIFIGFGSALLIIASIYIVSEFKIFYLLNIIAIIIPIALVTMLFLDGNDQACAIRVLIFFVIGIIS